jgi:hypothetical protein
MQVFALQESSPSLPQRALNVDFTQPPVHSSLLWVLPPLHLRILLICADYTQNDRLRKNIDEQRAQLSEFRSTLNSCRAFSRDYVTMEEINLSDGGAQIENKLLQFANAGMGFDIIHVATHGSPKGLYWADGKQDGMECCVDILKRFSEPEGAVLVLACCDSENLAVQLSRSDKFLCVYGTTRPLTPDAALGFTQGFYSFISRELVTTQQHVPFSLLQVCLVKSFELGKAKCSNDQKCVWVMKENRKQLRRPFSALLPCLKSHYQSRTFHYAWTDFNPVRFTDGALLDDIIHPSQFTVLCGKAQSGKSVVCQWLGNCRHILSEGECDARAGLWLRERFDVVLVISVKELVDAKLKLDKLIRNAFQIHKESASYIARELTGYSERVLWILDGIDDVNRSLKHVQALMERRSDGCEYCHGNSKRLGFDCIAATH